MPLYLNKECIFESIVNIVNSAESIDVVAILGNRYFGKNQLLSELQKHFSQKGDIYVIYPNMLGEVDLTFIESPLKRCYITAIIDKVIYPLKKKRMADLHNALKCVVSKANIGNIITVLYKYGVKKAKKQEFVLQLAEFDLIVLINIIKCLVNHDHLIFFLDSCKLKDSEVNHLIALIAQSQAHPQQFKCIDFVFGYRTSKSDFDQIARLKNHYPDSVHLLYLCPPIHSDEVSNNLPDSCPRMFLNNESLYRDVCSLEYINATYILPEYQEMANEVTKTFDTFAIALANIFAYESISMDQFNSLIDLAKNTISERPINRDCYDKTGIIHMLQGKYLIPDAWKYYAYFLYNSGKVITDTQDFFFMLFKNILDKNCDFREEYLINIEKLASTADLSNVTKGFSLYYDNLLQVTRHVIRKAQKRDLRKGDLELFSDFCANRAFYFSLYLVKFFMVLYDNSQCLFLLDKVLEILNKHLHTIGVLTSEVEQSLLPFIETCFKAADKWHDIGLYISVVETLELLHSKSCETENVNNLISMLAHSHNNIDSIVQRHGKQIYMEFLMLKKQKEITRVQDVKLGIITALPKEYEAMRKMLKNPEEIKVDTTGARGAGLRFCIGEIVAADNNTHFIALGMCGMGNNKAAIRAQKMIMCFPELKYIIMTGIAGGIPSPEDISKHVRLGDIIVSEGVIQYDMIVETPEGERCRSNTPPPAKVLLEAVDYMKGYEYRGSIPWHKHIEYYAKNKFEKRAIEKDILYDENDIIINHPYDGGRGKMPKVFYGLIGSANILLRNPHRRKELRSKGLFGVEMEGAGIADATWDNEMGYIVIRGVCDYCDDHKNDEWQDYAAITAAAYTRSLIENLYI